MTILHLIPDVIIIFPETKLTPLPEKYVPVRIDNFLLSSGWALNACHRNATHAVVITKLYILSLLFYLRLYEIFILRHTLLAM